MPAAGPVLRNIVVFGVLAGWSVACIDVATSLRHPIPALGSVPALATIVATSFALWLVPVMLAALLATVPIEVLGRRGLDRAALWWGLGLVVVAFAVLGTYQDLRRVPLRPGLARELLPSLLAAAWALPPGYLFASRLARGPAARSRMRWLAAGVAVGAPLVLLLAWSVNGIGAVPPSAVRAQSEVEPQVRHVVLITVDTLRLDHVSVYADGAPATPRLEALARDALVFDQAVAPSPWTKPSLASLQSGLTPAAHGVEAMGDRLAEQVDTLADVFSAAGYVTGLIGFNPYLEPEGNLGQGFQDYRGYPRGRLGASLAARAVYAYDLPVRRDAGDTPGLTAEAIDFIRVHHDEPFFLWLHYYDPHQPYAPPPEYMPEPAHDASEMERFNAFRAVRSGHRKLDAAQRRRVRALYAGEVRQADANVGRVLDALTDLGLYDDALVAFTSDHGEEFWEHGGFEHGHALYEELLRVPLLIKLPGSSPSLRVRERVPLEAVFSTVLAATGLATGDGLPRPAPLLSAAGWDDRDRDFVSGAVLYYESKVALTRNDKKYVRSLVTGEEELFDLIADPGETVSIAARSPALLEAMRERLDAHDRASGSQRSARGADDTGGGIDDSMRRNLEALGYAE